MTDESSFLAAINAARADDLPRLAYADWLDDRAGPGDPERARLIRLQVERYRLPETEPLPRIDGAAPAFFNRHSRDQATHSVRSEAAPPDDLLVGRLYDVWEPGAARPRVMRYVGRYGPQRGGGWAGEFAAAERPRAKALRAQEDAILKAIDPTSAERFGGRAKCYGWLWTEPLACLGSPTRTADSWTNQGWERGFPTRAELVNGDTWVQYADAVLAQIPLEEVELRTWPQMKTHGRLEQIPGVGPARVTDAWFGNLGRHDLDDLRFANKGGACAALLARYWPKVKFLPPK